MTNYLANSIQKQTTQYFYMFQHFWKCGADADFSWQMKSAVRKQIWF